MSRSDTPIHCLFCATTLHFFSPDTKPRVGCLCDYPTYVNAIVIMYALVTFHTERVCTVEHPSQAPERPESHMSIGEIGPTRQAHVDKLGWLVRPRSGCSMTRIVDNSDKKYFIHVCKKNSMYVQLRAACLGTVKAYIGTLTRKIWHSRQASLNYPNEWLDGVLRPMWTYKYIGFYHPRWGG
jgi:hypothetical protein